MPFVVACTGGYLRKRDRVDGEPTDRRDLSSVRRRSATQVQADRADGFGRAAAAHARRAAEQRDARGTAACARRHHGGPPWLIASDEAGVKRVNDAYRVLRPRPMFAAFTITSGAK